MKVFKIFSLILILFLIGCSREKNFICTIDIKNNVQNYSVTGKYKVYYKKDFVTRIEKQEKYLSNDKSVIDFFRESKELENYNISDKYGGVIYDIKTSDDSVNIKVKIDFKDFNVAQMAKDGSIDRDYVLGNKLRVNGIKHIYEGKGAICK